MVDRGTVKPVAPSLDNFKAETPLSGSKMTESQIVRDPILNLNPNPNHNLG
jgi:hypothetical protein